MPRDRINHLHYSSKFCLQGMDRGAISAIKAKRRTLKNRGYALNCRVRRIRNQHELEKENQILRSNLCQLMKSVRDLEWKLQSYARLHPYGYSPTHSSNTTPTPPGPKPAVEYPPTSSSRDNKDGTFGSNVPPRPQGPNSPFQIEQEKADRAPFPYFYPNYSFPHEHESVPHDRFSSYPYLFSS